MEYDFGSFDAVRAAGGTTISATADPDAANASLAGILGPGEAPAAPLPAATFTRLPVGYRPEGAGETFREATVRELNGAHEEEISRAGTNPFRYFDAIIRCGTTAIGPSAASDRLLRELTIADRDALLLSIRVATFGDTFEWEGWVCPHCGEKSDLTFHLKDVEMRSPIGDGSYSVELRDGRTAHLRLANGDDLARLYEREDLTAAEQNSVMITRCTTSIENADHSVGYPPGPDFGRSLGIADRTRILKAMDANGYGPDLNYPITHEPCGKQVTVPLAMAALFR